MKLLLTGLVVAALFALPWFAFTSLVLPELNGLQQVYGHADATVNTLVDQPSGVVR